MIVELSDFWWLCQHQPLLINGFSEARTVGTLEVTAYYDRDVGRVFGGKNLTTRSHETFISARFFIRMEFGPGRINSWPRVYETGSRHQSIARRFDIPVVDLHFYPTGEACLGFGYPWDPPLTLEYFMTEIVSPFFYRLAYVDLYGLVAAQADLWPEYPHGKAGLIEYREDVRQGLRVRKSTKNGRTRTRASIPR